MPNLDFSYLPADRNGLFAEDEQEIVDEVIKAVYLLTRRFVPAGEFPSDEEINAEIMRLRE